MPLLDTFLLFAGEGFVPPDGRCRKHRRVRSSEKKLSHTNSFVDIKKTAELRHFGEILLFFKILSPFLPGSRARIAVNRGFFEAGFDGHEKARRQRPAGAIANPYKPLSRASRDAV